MQARKPRTVLEELRAGQVVVCDGAMGTMLHAAGVPLDRLLPELNLSRPAPVRDLHAAYVSAGARLCRPTPSARTGSGWLRPGWRAASPRSTSPAPGWPARRFSTPGIR
jgi:Homocysteine S-methyltransferase